MKKILVSFACTLALALGASAQTVTFAQLPSVRTPSVLPNGYANLDWSGFYYVSPSWVGADVGLREGPNALNVAFMGGVLCELNDVSCSASISSAGATAAEGFIVHSAIVAAGSHAETVNVSAYNHGHFVGSEVYNLTASLQTMNFPPGWGSITQLVVDAPRGTVVFYDLNMESASAPAGEEVLASGLSHQNIGSTAPMGIMDPPPMDLPTIVEPPVRPPSAVVAQQNIGSTAPMGIMDPPPMGLPTIVEPPVRPPSAVVAQQNIGSTAPMGIMDPPPVDLPTMVKPPIIVIGTNAHNGNGATSPGGGRMAQSNDLIYPGSNAIRGAQPVDANATPKVQPD